MDERVRLIIEPISKRIMIPEGTTILDAILQFNLPVNAVCGGKGTCGQCKIQIKANDAKVSPLTPQELKFFSPQEIEAGYRLACQTRVIGNTRVYLTDTFVSNYSRILTERIGDNFQSYKIRPKFWKILLNLSKMDNIPEHISDFDKIRLAIMNEIPMIKVYNQEMETTFQCLKKIPHAIRKHDGMVTVTIESNIAESGEPLLILNVEAGNTTKQNYGVAFDIGTTTVVGYLVDFNNGEILAIESLLNPQTSVGEDIITRMEYSVKSSDNKDKMQQLAQDAINIIVDKLVDISGIKRDMIAEISVVGNTAMHHLFFGLPVDYLGRSPFPPVLKESIGIRNYHLNIRSISQNTQVYSPPVIAGFVGADTMADIISIRMDRIPANTLLIDIGTNGEMVLGNRSQGLTATSCAAGSAFEGAHIKNGMRGTKGAIELIEIDPTSFTPKMKVIGDSTPMGLCGSAIIDIIAEFLRCKIITRSGKFNTKYFNEHPHPRIRKGVNGWEYIVHSKEFPGDFISPLNEGLPIVKDDQEIVFTQDDVREVQKAKGAFLSGILLLVDHKHSSVEKIDQLLIAGAFGTYIHKENAHFIGLFPDLPMSRIYQIGNAAGAGAQALLLNTDLRQIAEELANKVEFHETANDPKFQHEFANSMIFPHQNLDIFPSLKEFYKDIPMR